MTSSTAAHVIARAPILVRINRRSTRIRAGTGNAAPFNEEPFGDRWFAKPLRG